MLLTGAFFFVAGTYTSIQSILDSYSTGAIKGFKPFLPCIFRGHHHLIDRTLIPVTSSFPMHQHRIYIHSLEALSDDVGVGPVVTAACL